MGLNLLPSHKNPLVVTSSYIHKHHVRWGSGLYGLISAERVRIQWKPLIAITLGPEVLDNNNRR